MTVALTARAAWSREIGSPETALRASLLGSDSFAIQGQGLPRDIAELGVTLDVGITDTIDLFAAYDGSLGGNYNRKLWPGGLALRLGRSTGRQGRSLRLTRLRLSRSQGPPSGAPLGLLGMPTEPPGRAGAVETCPNGPRRVAVDISSSARPRRYSLKQMPCSALIAVGVIIFDIAAEGWSDHCGFRSRPF